MGNVGRARAGQEDRLRQLEESVGGIKQSIAQLLDGLGKPKAPVLQAKPKSAIKGLKVPGFDAGTVQAALASGITPEQLKLLGGVMKQRPQKLKEVPRATQKKVVGPLSETEGEDEEPDAVEDIGESVETAPVPSVEKAILELTKIAGKLTEAKEKKDSLEVLLSKQFRRWRESGSAEECCCFASTAESRGREAQHCLPEHRGPTAQQLPFLSCEARRAIWARSHHPRLASQPVSSPELHQPCALELANLWDLGCLIAGKVEEAARARCAVLIAASDQASIDGGNWVLANSISEFSEPPCSRTWTCPTQC